MINLRVGKLIKKLRLEKEFTMSELAKEIKLSQSSLSRIESGTQELSITLLSTICEKLDITMSEFFRRLEHDISTTTIPTSNPNKGDTCVPSEEIEIKLLTWISSLNLEQKKALVTLIKSLNKR